MCVSAFCTTCAGEAVRSYLPIGVNHEVQAKELKSQLACRGRELVLDSTEDVASAVPHFGDNVSLYVHLKAPALIMLSLILVA